MRQDFSSVAQQFFASLGDAQTLMLLFDFLPDAYLYIKDCEGRFMRVNRSMLRARGMKSDSEIIGKTDLDIHPRYWALRYMEEDRRVMQTREPLVDQVWLVPDAKGKLELCVSSKIPLFDSAGQAIGIAGVRRPLNPSNDDSLAERGVEAAVRMITERYEEPLTIKMLASRAGLSHSQFNRRFMATYRMTPSNYLQRVRVHEASRQLTDTQRSVSEIALKTGFYDQAHLSRTFRKVLGLSPLEFRRLNRRVDS